MSHIINRAGLWVERIKVNAITREVRAGRAVWVKRRRQLAAPLLVGANTFFRLSHAPVRTILARAQWQKWEVDCFLGLHGAEGFRAAAEGAHAVWAEELPGENMTVALDSGALTPAMSAAAGRELRHAHAWPGAALGGAWSHGDPHVGNFIYEAVADRARIIDFEVRHLPAKPADERHADDLLVFLQDMAGRISAEGWLPCATAFLEAYARPEIVARLPPLLVLPSPGMQRLWWMVRASFLPPKELARLLADLRERL